MMESFQRIERWLREHGWLPGSAAVEAEADVVELGVLEMARLAGARRSGDVLFIPDCLTIRLPQEQLRFWQTNVEVLQEQILRQSRDRAVRGARRIGPGRGRAEIRGGRHLLLSLLPGERASASASYSGDRLPVLGGADDRSPDPDGTGRWPGDGTGAGRPDAAERLGVAVLRDGDRTAWTAAAAGVRAGRSTACEVPLPELPGISRHAATVVQVDPDGVRLHVVNRYGAWLQPAEGPRARIDSGGTVRLGAGDRLLLDPAGEVTLVVAASPGTAGGLG